MPAILGYFRAVNISSTGTVLVGDSVVVAPKSTVKTYTGSGGFLTGDFAASNSIFSTTNTNDPDITDSNIESGL
jgi:hypothetical protein